jgi:hypothetical protein
VKDANFTNAYVSTAGGTLFMQLNKDNLRFPGYQPLASRTPGCVQFTVSHGTVVPRTDSTNICPDGGSGSCGASPPQWPTPRIPLPSPGSCTSATSDFNWIILPP